ncbi:MAG: rod shape-determining protein MreC [Alphaproteobacteria bacterium]|nr:rod shape-determining protein MreC [Alphaproteobacteria bacterium]
MTSRKVSSRLRTIVKAIGFGCLIPAIVIYIIVAKPDFRFANGIAHVAFPIFNAIGDAVTWPFRAGGKLVKRIHRVSVLEEENKELRAKLAAALAKQTDCDVAILENKKLIRELGVARNSDYNTVIADVIYDNSAINHETFMINRGASDGVEPGMVVISFENKLVGVVIDSAMHFARVRSLIDSATNIAVRIADSEVYGFLHGDGSNTPTVGFFSDHKFQGAKGIKLLTSNISGVLPPDIYVGEMENESDVNVVLPRNVSRVIVLKFTGENGEYQ